MKRIFVALSLFGSLLAGCAPEAPATDEDVAGGETSTEIASTAVAPTATDVPPTLTPTPSRSELIFEGERAYAHAEAQMSFGPRPTGTDAWRLTGDYITHELEQMGWEVGSHRFTYQGVQGRNIVGRMGEGGESLLLIGAHYDTRREADRDPDTPSEPVPGANDGASGVAVLLELARVLDVSTYGGEIWLVFFDAEDNGHLDGWEYIAGSRAFAADMEVRPDAVIVVDMIGDADQQIFREATSDGELTTAIWETAADMGYGAYFVDEIGYSILDDHTPFLELDIPAVDIIDFDYPYWHTTDDTLDKTSAASLERVGRVLEELVEDGLNVD